MKRMFAILCAVLVMACAVVPCFASNWSEETPEYAGNAFITATEYPFLSVQLQVREVVTKAYQIGLFGGAKPVFVLYYFAQNSTNAQIMVAVPAHEAGYPLSADGLPKFTTYSTKYFNSANGTGVANNHNTQQPFALYQLSINGDWSPVAMYSATEVLYLNPYPAGGTSAGYKFVTAWGTATRPESWLQGTSIAEVTRTGWDESSTPLNSTIASIIERYDRVLDGTTEEVPEPVVPVTPILLDVPAIFDTMFNGIRSVLGGFDLEIFGISIVGMLVAFIVIAVVAFIVRKLWK